MVQLLFLQKFLEPLAFAIWLHQETFNGKQFTTRFLISQNYRYCFLCVQYWSLHDNSSWGFSAIWPWTWNEPSYQAVGLNLVQNLTGNGTFPKHIFLYYQSITNLSCAVIYVQYRSTLHSHNHISTPIPIHDLWIPHLYIYIPDWLWHVHHNVNELLALTS